MRRSALSLACLLVGACTVAIDPAGERAMSIVDLSGERRQPLEPKREARANVLFFITTDCPIANAYAPELRAIIDAYASKGFDFYIVHVDPDLTVEAAREHARLYGIDAAPILIDAKHAFVRALGITITPEVAVVLRGAELAYRGRIDDQWAELGQKRRAARTHDLRAALDAVSSGQTIPRARTAAVGCSVPVID